MPELLIEIFSEEIPARMQSQAAKDLQTLFLKAVEQRTIPVGDVKTYVTPRRLVLVAQDLAEASAARVEERRGPKVGAPEAALQGFLKSMGTTLDACQQVDGYWYARKEIAAQDTQSALGGIFEEIFAVFPWPKSMRWPGSSLPWVRPIRHIVCVFKGSPLVITVSSLGLQTQDHTVGHRFLAPQTMTVSTFTDYQTQLEKAYVILDPAQRQEKIRQQLDSLAQQQKLTWVEDQVLLNEVTGLVDYPFALLGRIDAPFMHLPAIILMTSMRIHQRYFAFKTGPGMLAPYFAVIANMPAEQDSEMLHGFERVLRARLSDANFFWEQDLRHSLETYTAKLSAIIFHAKLGTLAQKVERLQQLVTSAEAQRAARLCKSDLLTHMVSEFPELQGHMGEIYALAQGEKPAVAEAIRAHYQPLGPTDICPNEPVSIELSLADKIDTLVGFFGIQEPPSGSRDPYALRRAALGIIRLIRENNLQDFDLQKLAQKAVDLYKMQGLALTHPNPADAVYEFILERLAVGLKAEAIRYDCVQAVITPQQRQGKTLWSMAARASALHTFLETESGLALFMAARRCLRILSDAPAATGPVDKRLLSQTEEQQLYAVIQPLQAQLGTLLSAHDYGQAMQALSETRTAVDAFFEKVTVNTDEPALRQNRFALLQMLAALFAQIADFNQLEG
jgi:glycyl-tRNA synthetase beta chain